MLWKAWPVPTAQHGQAGIADRRAHNEGGGIGNRDDR
jgi:hypothetical protein